MAGHPGRRLSAGVAEKSSDRRRKNSLLAASLAAALATAQPVESATFTHVADAPTIETVLWSSPVLVDLDGNPRTLEIVVGDEGGNIYAFDCTGAQLWTFSIRNFPGFESCQTACQSSPLVADLDGDGAKEVVVSLATRDVASMPGALFMFRLDSNGMNPTIAGGFARWALDRNSDGVPDGFFASPTAADIDDDGQMEILACSWDELVYALRSDGSQVWHLNYDPTDPQEFGFKTGDTIWTTPSVADIDLDGINEVVVGSDAHDFPWGHQIPFQTEPGGVLVVLEGPTGMLDFAPPGWGRFFIESYHEEGADWYYNPQGENHIPLDNPSQVLQSSPVIADVDADGLWEIVHGTGQIFWTPTGERHNRVFCWSGESAILQWDVDVRAEVFACCALANMDDEPDLEVLFRDFKWTGPSVWAVKGSSGAVLPGFPAPIKDGNPASLGPVVGDVEGDGEMEIILVSFGRIHVFGADGQEEQSFDLPQALFATPAIGDIDDDGRCEMVVPYENGLAIYRCNGTVGPIPWGQYRRDERNSGVMPHYDAQPARLEVLTPLIGGENAALRAAFHNVGSEVWTADKVVLLNATEGWGPGVIGLPPTTHVLNGRTLRLDFWVEVPPQTGTHVLTFQLYSVPEGTVFGRPLALTVVVEDVATGMRRWRLYD